MAEPPSPLTVIETLRSMGLSDADIACEELREGWRIRAQGGLVVHLRKDGQLTVSGAKTHAVRKALGLTGRRQSRSPIFVESEKHGAGRTRAAQEKARNETGLSSSGTNDE